MKKVFYFTLIFVGFLFLLVTAGISQRMPQKLQTKPSPDLQQVNKRFAVQGLRFTENLGQVADLNGRLRPDILFTAQNEGVKLFLTANGIHYQFRREFTKPVQANERPGLPRKTEWEEVDSTQFYRLDLSLKGANPNPKVIKDGVGVDLENFFLPHCPDGITGVKNYNRITYKEVYPNIDWVVYVKEGMLEYDFVVGPGGNIEDIKLQYKGAENLDLDKTGALHIKTPLGKVTEQKPFSFQQEGKEVASRFVLEGNTLGFEVPGYNENKALTIDPSIVWATYYGGSGNDIGYACDVDVSGNVFLAGSTTSTNSIASGGFQNIQGGSVDAFLVKFDASGVRKWATYYGGSSLDQANSCATDASGNVFIAGHTSSTTGIAYNGFQNNHNGGVYDAFLVKFNGEGLRIWGTYYGSSGFEDKGADCTTDMAGNVFLAGYTKGITEIAFRGYQNSSGGLTDAFLVKFNSDGVRIWGTFYGGAQLDIANSCTVDALGNVFLAGNTASTSGIASGGFQNVYGGISNYTGDAFLVKFNSSGARLWATYYGGTGFEEGKSCAVDANGNIYLAGNSNSNSAIAFEGHQNIYGGQGTSLTAWPNPHRGDAFLAKFNESGARVWATYYGGSNDETGNSCVLDGFGNIFLAGSTISPNNIASDGIQNSIGGGEDSYLVKFKVDGTRTWGTYLGGVGTDRGFSCASDAAGNVYISGSTVGFTDLTLNGFQNLFGGVGDAFLFKIGESDPQADSDGDGVPDLEDCSPNNHDKFQNASLFIDQDNDGYDGGRFDVCYGNDIPEGYKSTTSGFDCNDSDPLIYRSSELFIDIDNDGYDGGKVLVCYGIEIPTGYKTVSFGFDCDDNNANVFRSEYLFVDLDNDGYHSDEEEVCYGEQIPSGYKTTTLGFDCNDANAAVNPGAPEICDGIDNNCDGVGDEGSDVTWYKDADYDGYSDGLTLTQCSQPSGYKLASNLTATSGDCDDSKAAIHPGATELCDGLDNDCDAQTDEGCPVGTAWYFDYDMDGYGNANKVVYAVSKPYKYVANPDDCRDWDAAYHPGATELCDGKDNDCDGLIDEGCPGLNTWYRDGDHDGYGNPKYTKTTVGQPAGYVDNADDCKDWDANVYPGHGCPPVTGITGTDGNTIMPKAMVESSPEMVVFPNPATTVIMVTLNGFETGKKLELQLVQADGKVVLGQSLTPFMQRQQVRMDIRQAGAGFYLLLVRQGQLQQAKRVIILR